MWSRVVRVGLVVATTAIVLFGTAKLQPDGGDQALDAAGYALVTVAGAALLGLRRWPVATAGVVTAAIAGYAVLGYPDGPMLVFALAALYGVAASCRRHVAYLTASGVSAVVLAVNVIADGGMGVADLLFVGWAAAAVLAADAVRGYRDRVAARRDRARWQSELREQETQRRIAEERLRIGRDLHDSVAHSMAIINVQSGVAAHVIDVRPEVAKEALGVIRAASAEALEELAAMVRVLRSEPEQPALRPAPGLGELPDLVASVRQAGLRVELTMSGSAHTVARPIGQAVYRIIQEALTNVVRHARATRADVVLDCAPHGAVSLRVVDDGAALTNTTGGTKVGIMGMRERAESTGGRLDAAVQPGGGFRVAAQWPGSR